MRLGMAATYETFKAELAILNQEFADCFHGSTRFIDGAFASTLWDVKMISNTF